ncbi:MAG: DUF4956 domain-containing protein [Herbinix sp.]|nr:DUF4956 domain-containing protein [Herbinix sp.]
MSVQDMIKKSILESDMYNQAISMTTIITIAVNMFVALLMGILIYIIYKKFFNGVVYSKNYAVTLVGMTILTCMVTLAISTNIVISLGMVGALSIVRYRTAIKEPMDLLYMFWAITTGITIGASMYILAVIGALFVFFMILCFQRNNNKSTVFIMIVHYTGYEAGDMILKTMGKMKYIFKSKTMRNYDTELTLQVHCKQDNLVFLERIRAINQVNDVTIVQYNGEYNG